MDEKSQHQPLTSVFLALLNHYYKRYQSSILKRSSENQSVDVQNFNSTFLVDSLISSINDPSSNINQNKFNKLQKFLRKIENSYQNVPYHNHHHAVDVLTAVDVLMNQVEESGLAEFTLFERVTLLLAAACHDVGHPGVTAEHIMRNQFHAKSNGLNITSMFKNENNDENQNNASTLSKGMLERYHSTVALCIMREYGIDLAFYDDFTNLFHDCIMATDMSNHASIVKTLSEMGENSQKNKSRKIKLSENDRSKLLPIIKIVAD